MTAPESITCPKCGMTSHNPNDIKQGYCGNCHWWTSDPVLSEHYKEVAMVEKRKWSQKDEALYQILLFVTQWSHVIVGAAAGLAWYFISFWAFLGMEFAYLLGGLTGIVEKGRERNDKTKP